MVSSSKKLFVYTEEGLSINGDPMMLIWLCVSSSLSEPSAIVDSILARDMFLQSNCLTSGLESVLT